MLRDSEVNTRPTNREALCLEKIIWTSVSVRSWHATEANEDNGLSQLQVFWSYIWWWVSELCGFSLLLVLLWQLVRPGNLQASLLTYSGVKLHTKTFVRKALLDAILSSENVVRNDFTPLSAWFHKVLFASLFRELFWSNRTFDVFVYKGAVHWKCNTVCIVIINPLNHNNHDKLWGFGSVASFVPKLCI
jgi:hypothetical protein